MKTLFLMAGLGVVLTACGPAVETGNQVATDVRDDTYKTAQHLKDWLSVKPEKPPQGVPSTYCYRSQTDILCYRQPMPGWEHRLVGYQGTGAAPPPPATMEPLILQEPDRSQLPISRVAGAQPVFVQAPPDVTTAADASALTPIDRASEPQPDPASAPQL